MTRKPDLQKGKQPAQLLIVVLLSIITITLLGMIIYFFQPGRMQLWQKPSQISKNDNTVIRRLEPAETEETEPLMGEVIKEETADDEKTVEPTPASRLREARIYFVKVNAEGQISLKSVNRSIDFSNSPLTQTINTLIRGPGSDEMNKGSLSLIPEDTRLLSARVDSGTAYLNFNEAFRFNPLGREGYLAQLKQIVYTSTEFSSIKNVQIQIEGVIREYLGGEGFYIGEPLDRESFQNQS